MEVCINLCTQARYSPFTNTFFDGKWCKLELCTVVDLILCWVHQFSVHHATKLVDVTKKNVIDYYNYCREICAIALEKRNSCVIGGVNQIVEIDESKIFKRKYDKGRYLSMQEGWAFGGIQRSTKERFVVLVPDRKEATLLPIIQKYIKVGTTIMSDEWRSYFNLDKYGYKHYTVNHSKNFVNPEDPNVHTQSIECNWRYLKNTFPKNGTSDQLKESYVDEFVYRQVHKDDFVNMFFEDIKMLYPWKLERI